MPRVAPLTLPTSALAPPSLATAAASSSDDCYQFSDLDTTFRKTPFYVAWVNKTAGDDQLEAALLAKLSACARRLQT